MSEAICHGELPELFADVLPVCGQKWPNGNLHSMLLSPISDTL